MKRWNAKQMLEIGQKLFAKVAKRKQAVSHNHDLHFLAREIEGWLPKGIQSIINGSYTPRHLKRRYFPDEVVDQLHPSDRIFQHLVLRQLKPTFKHVMSPNCYHLDGPTGVKYATQQIREILQKENPQYILRVDIKSFYKSIQHHKLIRDIKKYYDDPKVQVMLEDIITNAIETPRGYKNPGHGIALRGPLSQFFSGIYLKPLDDAFTNMQVFYLRYQDDVIILCKTQRQLNRCRRRMMEILHERGLSLSRKKKRMGHINSGFHYLGIHYLPTQPEGYTNETHVNDDSIAPSAVHNLHVSRGGGVAQLLIVNNGPIRLVPHARTLRKAREQIKWMVKDGASLTRIKHYLHRFVIWWATTSALWHYEEILQLYSQSCWDKTLGAIAQELLRDFTLSHTPDLIDCQVAA